LWKKIEINPNKEYVLHLCRYEHRFCRVVEKISKENKGCLVFSTEVIPNSLLKKYETKLTEENYKTIDGRKFYI